MSVNIDKVLRNAKTEIRAGRAAQVRGEVLMALEKFPANARLLTALAEVQQAATGLPLWPASSAAFPCGARPYRA